MGQCPKCGAELPAGARFCSVCGSPAGRRRYTVPLMVVGGCLLLVVLFVGAGAAIMWPVFSRARQSARAAECVSNMRQVAVACLQYSMDWNENLPSAVDLTAVYL